MLRAKPEISVVSQNLKFGTPTQRIVFSVFLFHNKGRIPRFKLAV